MFKLATSSFLLGHYFPYLVSFRDIIYKAKTSNPHLRAINKSFHTPSNSWLRIYFPLLIMRSFFSGIALALSVGSLPMQTVASSSPSNNIDHGNIYRFLMQQGRSERAQSFRGLDPEKKSGVFPSRINDYSTTHNLDEPQNIILDQAIKMIEAGQDPASLRHQAKEVFGPGEFKRLMTTLEDVDTPVSDDDDVNSSKPDRRYYGYSYPDCNCAVDSSWCDEGYYCKGAWDMDGTCEDPWDVCGTWGNYDCDGLCDLQDE
jgi:hypothetical protein